MKNAANVRILRWLIGSLVVGALINGMIALGEWHTVTSSSGPDLRILQYYLFFPFAAAALAIPAGLIALAFKRTRRHSLLVAVFCISYVMTFVASLTLAKRVRIYGLHSVAERAQGLIGAIGAYEARYGKPPTSLENLVPEFLPSVPDTGIAAYPKFEYSIGDSEAARNGNPWMLYVSTPVTPLDWDMFVYFPNQNYPSSGYGGTLERVGKWAYVHE